jgi:hypothetical protein
MKLKMLRRTHSFLVQQMAMRDVIGEEYAPETA